MKKSIVPTGLFVVGGAMALGSMVLVMSTDVAPAGVNQAVICGQKASASHLLRVTDPVQLTDGEIAFIYIQANQFEVEKAELGIARGSAPEVKAHGKMVAKDHRGVVKVFQELLKQNGVEPVAPAGSDAAVKKHKAIMAKLVTMSGSDFDRAYLIHEMANHRAVIKAIRDVLVPALTSTPVVAHMNEVLPAFEHHLAMTVKAAKKLGIGVGQ